MSGGRGRLSIGNKGRRHVPRNGNSLAIRRKSRIGATATRAMTSTATIRERVVMTIGVTGVITSPWF
jgi:hypothetical protein